MGRKFVLKIRLNRDSILTVTGRDAWALDELVKAGKKGCTPIDAPGPRWSGYIHSLRGLGIDIETIHEALRGRFRAPMVDTCCAQKLSFWSVPMARRTGRGGRSKYPEGQYWPLPYSQAQHAAFRALSGSALKVYVELHCRYTVRGDGSNNNGALSLSLGDAAKLLHIGKATALRALAELESAGFIAKVKEGHWYGRKAAEYRLTDQRCKDTLPTRAWQQISREKQNAVLERNISKFDGSILEPAE